MSEMLAGVPASKGKTNEGTKLIRLINLQGGIPSNLKMYKTINVSQIGGLPSNKVIRVVLPQQQVISEKTTQDNNIPDFSSKCAEDSDGAPLSKNAMLARENRLKKKRYINGLQDSLSTAKKENETLHKKLGERDETIKKLQKEIVYFKSILANVQEISSLINTIQQDTHIPMSTSLGLSSLKRSRLEMQDEVLPKKMKIDRLSESSGELSSIHEDDTIGLDDWMPSSPQPSRHLDADSLELFNNFSEDDFVESTSTGMDAAIAAVPKAGVCLHVFNKKVSLEFCSSCAIQAQEKWSTALKM